MKRLLVGYCLFPFIGFFIVLSLTVLIGKSINSLEENIFIAFVFALILALIVGTLYYFYDTKWGPGKRAKILSKSPFKELKEHGFQEYEDFIWGIINGYTVFISFVWFTGKPAINIEILFNPKSVGHFLGLQELKQIRKRNKISSFFNNREYAWQRNAVGYLIEYNFKPPLYEKILGKAAELTEILVKENLKVISKEETATLLTELREWIKANKEEQSIS